MNETAIVTNAPLVALTADVTSNGGQKLSGLDAKLAKDALKKASGANLKLDDGSIVV